MDEKARRRLQWKLGGLAALIVGVLALGLTDSLGALVSSPVIGRAVLAAVIVLGVYLTHYLGRAETSRLTEMRRHMAAFFATIVIESPHDERFAFDGRAAAIVEDEEALDADEMGQLRYEVKRYARNPGGEYFWFILEISGKTPRMVFVKHVPHNIARFVLKEKYVAPPGE